MSFPAPRSSAEISVIIPAYNAGKFIARCLEGLQQQTLPRVRFEIIVVDDGSTDNTAEVVEQARLANLLLASQPNAGPAAARNTGIRLATAPLVAFLDSDCVPRPDWLENLLLPMKKRPDLLGLEGKTVPEARPLSPLDHFIDNPNGGYYWTCNIAYRTETLREIGGFDEGFPMAASEDIDLAQRVLKLGKIEFTPNACVEHLILKRSFKGHVSRALMFSSLMRLARKHPGLIVPEGSSFWTLYLHQIRYFALSMVGFRRWLLKNPAIFLRYCAIHITMIGLTLQHLPRFYREFQGPLEIREPLSREPVSP